MFFILRKVHGHQCDAVRPGLPTLCFKKVWKLREVLNVRVAAGHRPAQAQEPAGWWRFSVLSEITEFFCKMESKFLNSKVLAGGFVMGCAKRFWFSVNIKSSRTVCSITKSLRSQT